MKMDLKLLASFACPAEGNYCCRKTFYVFLATLFLVTFYVLLSLQIEKSETLAYQLSVPRAIGSHLSSDKVQVSHFNSTPDHRQKWVILHTYMRGGSTLLGSMFESNKDAFYWFEPIHDVYQAALGMKYCKHPIKIYSNKNNRTRSLTEYENKAIITYIKNLLGCQPYRIPVEFVLGGFIRKFKAGAPYMKCMKNFSIDRLTECFKFLPKKCTSRRSSARMNIENHCHEYLNFVHEVKRSNSSRVALPQSIKNLGARKKLFSYVQCVKPIQEQHQKCLLSVQLLCEKSGLKVIKVIRSNPKLTLNILQNKNAYIVHQVRDPRGIIMSRRHNKVLSRMDIKAEAAILCEKMNQDLNIFRKLEEQNHTRILFVKYEDLATSPQLILKKVYNFLNQDITTEVKDFFQNLNGINVTEKAFLSVQRKNGMKTALAWRQKITKLDKIQIDNVCKQFLTEANYEL